MSSHIAHAALALLQLAGDILLAGGLVAILVLIGLRLTGRA